MSSAPHTTLSEENQALNSILRKSQEKGATPLLPDEVSHLIAAFSLSQPSSNRSKAHLVLSSYCQGVRSASKQVKESETDPATETLKNVFASPVLSRLSEPQEQDVLFGLSFLTALFQVDWQTASSIFLQDGVVELLSDIHDLFSSPQSSIAVARLLSQASGYKPCRAAMSSESTEWLGIKSRQRSDTALRAAAAIALVKMSRGARSDSKDESTQRDQASLTQDEGLARLMSEVVVTGEDQSSLSDAVEGLAYLSVDPIIKQVLCEDATFLSKMFLLAPKRKGANKATEEINSSLLYGITLIISNLVAYRPRLSEEETQIQNLKRMARAGSQSGPDKRNEDMAFLDDDEHVKERCQQLIAAGVLDVLTAVPAIDSRGLRLCTGKAFLSLIEDKENRSKILQSGGGKALVTLIRQIIPSKTTPKKSSPQNVDTADLDPIQALAKLSITASPLQVFGPNEGAVYDAIRPISIMLLHPSSTLLQKFEAMMALTNMTSQSPEVASRVAAADGFINRVELLLLEQHVLVRRAAMELMCNLIIGSDTVFERYSGPEDSRGYKSKVQVLLALSDVDDLPTRLAASGALTTLTSTPSACRALFDLHQERRRVLPVIAQLIDPRATSTSVEETEEDDVEDDVESSLGDPGLVLRGVICARNFLLSCDKSSRKGIAADAASAGLISALAKVIKGELGPVNPQVAAPASDILNFLVEVEQS